MPRNETRSAGKRPMRAMTPQEKMDAIGRVHSGESKAAVARDIGVPESTLRGWCKAEDKIRNQLNNVRGSATYEPILTSGSSADNSDNSRPGSSGSTPPTQNTMGIPTSGAAERPSEESEGPALKRAKIENNLTSSAAVAAATAAAINMNSIPPTRANDAIFSNYFYNLFANDPNKSVTQQLLNDSNKIAILSSLMAQGESLLPYSGYPSITNLLTADTLAQLHRNNGVMANMTMAANMLPTNNMQVNGKRKYNALTSTVEAPTKAMRRQNDQSPNVEKPSGSISQPSNSRTSPLPSTSGNNGEIANTSARLPKDCKKLDDIICLLQQQQRSDASQVCNMREVISNNTINNNNVDHVDNETTIRRSPQELPPGFSEMISSCSKLIDWLGMYGTPICTFKHLKHMKAILNNMIDWANHSKGSIEAQRTINDMS